MIRVFPAPAGINRVGHHNDTKCRSVPRASGDKPIGNYSTKQEHRCSPRQRG